MREVGQGKRASIRPPPSTHTRARAGDAPQRGNLRPLRVPEDCPQEVADLFISCTRLNPEERPGARILGEALTRIVAAAGPARHPPPRNP